MFNAYRMLSPDTPDYFHAFFAEALNADDIVNGTIDRVFVPARVFELYGEDVPLKGDVLCVTGSDGDAICLIKVTDVRIGNSSGERVLYEAAPDETGAAISFSVVFS